MKQKTIFIAAIILLGVAFIGATQFYRSHKAQQAEQSAARNRESLVRFHSPTMGSADAPVHIVEFLDPACETCAAFYPLVKKLMAENPDKIRLTVRYAPFHRGSDEVVKALEAARKQGKYWQALEALLAGQASWTLNHTARVELVWPLLVREGLDVARIRNDMGSAEIARAIEQDLADGLALNVTKTPEYFVNGRPLPQFGFDELKALVREELAKAAAGN
ncbi:MAG TPA: thioredoxin domain-containing protein [Noviherbaspirillum sp.]|uniref:DsbA family protein n=1 Tax=Noviherbaspirillum sp. TaxID=1926288 RepID=UPI002D45589D|nr:thioredoxin domain-containing protein [Noviherbaspirillum sp.]HYD95937.1 thioredoxin domain-containing protein [Noviherbaspirillum sp.]